MEAPPPRDDPVPAAKARARLSLECDVCGGPTFEVRCKITCRRCGYTRDCSDP